MYYPLYEGEMIGRGCEDRTRLPGVKDQCHHQMTNPQQGNRVLFLFKDNGFEIFEFCWKHSLETKTEFL